MLKHGLLEAEQQNFPDLFFRATKNSIFLSGQALTPPPPLNGRANKKKTVIFLRLFLLKPLIYDNLPCCLRPG